jgi:transposase-like protein
MLAVEDLAMAKPTHEFTITGSSWRELLDDLLEQALDQHGSIRQAAKALGVPRSTLASWCTAAGVASPRRRAALKSAPVKLSVEVARALASLNLRSAGG